MSDDPKFISLSFSPLGSIPLSDKSMYISVLKKCSEERLKLSEPTMLTVGQKVITCSRARLAPNKNPNFKTGCYDEVGLTTRSFGLQSQPFNLIQKYLSGDNNRGKILSACLKLLITISCLSLSYAS